MVTRVLAICVALTAGRVAAAESDAELPARHRVLYKSLTAIRVNPLGLAERFSLEYRYRLYDDPGLLWRDGHASIAFTPLVTPSVAYVGATARLKPIAVAELSVAYFYVGLFNTFGYLQSYPSPRARFSDSDIDLGKDAGQSYGTDGTALQITLRLQAKVGPIVLRNTAAAYWSNADLRAGDTVYYETVNDLLVPDRGWYLNDDIDLVWLSGFGLVAGIRTTVGHAFYEADDYLPGEPTQSPNVPTVRTGPLLAYVFADDLGRMFNKPTLLVIANWWIAHRWRTGRDVSGAIPYFMAAFQFEGELWSN